jgi:hypothetical protein
MYLCPQFMPTQVRITAPSKSCGIEVSPSGDPIQHLLDPFDAFSGKAIAIGIRDTGQQYGYGPGAKLPFPLLNPERLASAMSAIHGKPG